MIIPNEWFPEKFLAIEMIKKCKMKLTKVFQFLV